jgi:deoxyribodipyrimidine photo-lyase
MTSPILFWYRQDLRIDDLPGLAAAAATGRPIVPCYILDDETPGAWRAGAASRWWLHHSLSSLSAELAELGGNLVLKRGESADILEQLVQATGAGDVFCTRMYEPWAADLENRLHTRLPDAGIGFKRYGGTLLFEPENIRNRSGQPYKVFSPFWRECLAAAEPAQPKDLDRKATWWDGVIDSDLLADWQLRPERPDWAADWERWWTPGSAGAAEKLDTFLQRGLQDYSEGRNHPALERTTRLSAHLHHGELSPGQVWHRVRRAASDDPALDAQVDKFLSELGWREFSYHLMHHFPSLYEEAFKAPFREFPWLDNGDWLRAWQSGLTGYPMVDAGMRELWHTGYMHNRVRMIVASFLTKHLLIHWRRGAEWFWDTLVDADLANNSCGWQWVAGSGADASPYFRIFNPVTQGEKFDKKGVYIRQWIPELAQLPDRYLHAPWKAPADTLERAGITLGVHYPLPLVEHKSARESALAAYASLRE